MNKHVKKAKATYQRSNGWVVGTWVAGFFSLGLLYLVGSAVEADAASFRSCSANNSGLVVSSCGKQSVNPGDLVLLLLFILTACLVVAIFTAAWRMTKRPSA